MSINDMNAPGSAPNRALPDFERSWSRRSLLKGLGVTGLGAILGSALLGEQSAEAATPNRATRRAAAKVAPKANPSKRKVGATSGGLISPYSLDASTELSEDHFLTSNLLIGTDDLVIPFTNPFTKQVEAVTFAGGNLAHLYRDATAISGWTYATIDSYGTMAAISNVAVAASATAVFLLAFGTPGGWENNQVDSPVWLTKLDGATTWNYGAVEDPDTLYYDATQFTGPIQGGVSATGTCFFYAPLQAGDELQVVGWIADDDANDWEFNTPLSPTLYYQNSGGGNTVQDVNLLLDTSGSGTPTGFLLMRDSARDLTIYPQTGGVSATTPPFANRPITFAGASGVTELMWAWATPGDTAPGYAIQISNSNPTIGGAWFIGASTTPGTAGNAQHLLDNAGTGGNALAVWQQNDLWTVNLLDPNGTLNTALETAPGTWQAPITTVAGLAAIFGVPTDPNESTLFAIGLDETLSVLTLDSSGWTQTLVRTVSATRVEIDSYRTQISVLDANGIPAAGAQVQVSTDRPVGIWQAAGSSFITPAAPATFAADGSGQVIFSIPAEEMDCAELTVTSLDVSNGATLLVLPDTDVRGFFAGTGTLTDLGAIAGTTMLQAKNSAGTALFPGLTGLSGDAQTQAVTGTTTALTQFITAGQQGTPGTNDIKSIQVDMSSGVPTVQTSTTSGAYTALPKAGQLHLSLSHLFDTIGHALRHGVAKVAHLVVQWSEDAKAWVVNIGAQISGALLQFENMVISDMKDAFHAIGGFFQALGADIKDAMNWLRHNVLDLLKAAWTNAGTIGSFIASAPTALAAQVTQFKSGTDGFFAKMETDAKTLLGEVETAVTGMTLMSPAPQPAPSTDTGSTGSQSKLLKDVSEFNRVINDTPGMWLWHKLQNDVRPIISIGVPTLPAANYQTLLEDLATDWNDAEAFMTALLTFMQDSWTDLFGQTKSSASSASMETMFSQIINDADNVVLTFLQMCDAICDTVLDVAIQALNDMGDYLTTDFKLIDSTSLLGQIFDLIGIDITINIGEVAGLVVAFPATLVSTILGNGSTMPEFAALPTGSSGAKLAESDTAKLWLGIVGGTTQCVWGLADIIGDVQTLTDDSGKRGTQSGIVDMVDIFAPVLESAFLFPLPLDQKLEKQLVPPIIFTALLPSIFGILGLMSWPTVTAKVNNLPDGVGDAVTDYFSPFIQSFAGVANTALGVAFQVKNGDTVPTDIAGTVLGNLSFILAMFGTFWLNATTDDIPVLVKTVVDAVGNVGAAICIYEATSLPPK